VKVGDTIADKYRIERVLGRGGMGVVVAARHMGLGERVAIKFLLPHVLERKEIVARFLREGRAAAGIRSEHVARVFDVGTLPDGAPYLVMEYLEGQDLGAVVREKGQLPIAEAVAHVLQASEALAEAHAAGTIHRDLKPANLFLTRRADRSATIKLIDFGISKLATDKNDPASSGGMTGTAVSMGSPHYMAPEQMVSARDVTARADIWSLGAILYCLLTGKPPFPASSVLAVHELILLGSPKLRDGRPDAPEGLDRIVARCLQRNPDKRFPDLGAFAAALAEFAPPALRFYAERIERVIRDAFPLLPSDADASQPVEDAGASPSPVEESVVSAAPESTAATPPGGASGAPSESAGTQASMIAALPGDVSHVPPSPSLSLPVRKLSGMVKTAVPIAVGLVVAVGLAVRGLQVGRPGDAPSASPVPPSAVVADRSPTTTPSAVPSTSVLPAPSASSAVGATSSATPQATTSTSSVTPSASASVAPLSSGKRPPPVKPKKPIDDSRVF
jgi:eukaryotic-like serine/threonine-protein kinase